MGCKICGKNYCLASFHTFEEQDEYDETFGPFENRINMLKDRKCELEKQVDVLWDIITEEQKEENKKDLKKVDLM